MTKNEIIDFFDILSNNNPNCSGLEKFLSKNGSPIVFNRIEELSNGTRLNYTQLNQLFIISELNGVNQEFFNYYWLTSPPNHPYNVTKVIGYNESYIKSNEIISIEHLKWGFYRLYIDSFLYFGNITLGFYQLSNKSGNNLTSFFDSKRFDTDYFVERGPMIKPTDIYIDDRYLISEMACKNYEADYESEANLIRYLIEQYKIAVSKGTKRISVTNLLKKNYLNEEDKDDTKFQNPTLFDIATSEIKEEIIESEDDIKRIVEPIAKRFVLARKTALDNTHYYLSIISDLDIYVATSMRTKQHFDDMAKTCKDIFEHFDLRNYHLRYFDPTLGAAKSHEDKGLIECLMVRCAKILVYSSGETDSYGKDAEAAMALSSGKPVIFYCPPKSNGDDSRYKIAKNIHPLTKLIDFKTGVANGAIIVKSINDVVALLKRIINNDMEYYIDKKKSTKVEDDGYFMLVEKLSECFVRIQTNDTILSKSFWNYFERHIKQ
jgi:hypothetical protein